MKKILSIIPTANSTFVIRYKEQNILKTVETRCFDAAAFIGLKKATTKEWLRYLEHGTYKIISQQFLKTAI